MKENVAGEEKVDEKELLARRSRRARREVSALGNIAKEVQELLEGCPTTTSQRHRTLEKQLKKCRLETR